MTTYKKAKKAIEKEIGCNFIRIDRDKEDYNVFRHINEIFSHIKQSTKKALTSKTSTRLLRLEFKSDNTIKSKTTKVIVKKDYKQ